MFKQSDHFLQIKAFRLRRQVTSTVLEKSTKLPVDTHFILGTVKGRKERNLLSVLCLPDKLSCLKGGGGSEVRIEPSSSSQSEQKKQGKMKLAFLGEANFIIGPSGASFQTWILSQEQEAVRPTLYMFKLVKNEMERSILSLCGVFPPRTLQYT